MSPLPPIEDAPAPRARSGSRRPDALSLFLGASVLMLVIMYLVDGQQESRFERHQIQAAGLNVGGIDGSCQSFATGLTGEEALITCAGRSRAELLELLRAQWRESPPPDWLAQIALRDAQGTTRCDRALTTCQEFPRREPAFFQEARRRRPSAQN